MVIAGLRFGSLVVESHTSSVCKSAFSIVTPFQNDIAGKRKARRRRVTLSRKQDAQVHGN